MTETSIDNPDFVITEYNHMKHCNPLARRHVAEYLAGQRNELEDRSEKTSKEIWAKRGKILNLTL